MDEILTLDFHSVSSDTDVESIQSEEHPSFMDKLTNSEYLEWIDTIYSFIEEYLQNNMLGISKPGFHEDLIDEVTYVIFQPLLDAGIYTNNDFQEVQEHVEYYANTMFESGPVPFRQESGDNKEENSISESEKETIERTIHYLRTMPQPKQRTAEWYDFRHNMLTASNIWKAFSTESQYNSLVYEKCKTIHIYQIENAHVNTESPLHWGVKYEPLTVMVYETLSNVKVEDFGCIRHREYPFLGASPDGIVVSDHLYGRMVEIKNIVNREIDGIPSEAYWIQMQLQMETCELDICDFVETRFKEYEESDDFYKDEFLDKGQKGIILYFIAKKGSTNPHYIYMPLDLPLDKESIDSWVHLQKEEIRETHGLFQTLYWRLDEYSCIQVIRNRLWFREAVSKIEEVWKVIEKERIEGFEHRAAKKRKPVDILARSQDNSSIFINMPTTQNICLVKLEGE